MSASGCTRSMPVQDWHLHLGAEQVILAQDSTAQSTALW